MSERYAHSPGPWNVGTADWSGEGNVRYELAGIDVISRADANLIEAAPELLEALIALHAVASVECDEDYAAVTNAAAVIAKATGA